MRRQTTGNDLLYNFWSGPFYTAWLNAKRTHTPVPHGMGKWTSDGSEGSSKAIDGTYALATEIDLNKLQCP